MKRVVQKEYCSYMAKHISYSSSSQFSLTLSLGHLFVASLISVKRGPTDKVKENCETNLKVHCVVQLQLSLCYKVFRWHLLNIMLQLYAMLYKCVPYHQIKSGYAPDNRRIIRKFGSHFNLAVWRIV